MNRSEIRLPVLRVLTAAAVLIGAASAAAGAVPQRAGRSLAAPDDVATEAPGIAAIEGGGGTIPPNVLVIVLDDVGTDKLELYGETPGHDYAVTPELDALAEEGILFTNYYTNPLCSTGRACLLTGRYAFRTGLGSAMDSPTAACPDPTQGATCYNLLDEVFLSELLRKGFPANKSFRSGAFGKWHLSYWTPQPPPPADPVPPFPGLESHAVDNGFDRFYGTMENMAGGLGLDDHFIWQKVEHDAAGGNPPQVLVIADLWNASVVRQDAVAWINAQTRPFFAYVAFHPPHTPTQVPPLGLLSQDTRDALTSRGYAMGDMALAGDGHLVYRAMLEAVDAEIGNLIDGIDALKRVNTTIFVVADNGTPQVMIADPPHDHLHGKATVYQLGVRVPMIVSGRGVPAAPAGGWRCSELVQAVDLWRTIGALTGASEALAFTNLGISPAPPIDSRSFLPLIHDPLGPGPRDWAFVQLFLRNREPLDLYTPVSYDCLLEHGRAITDGEFKLIRRLNSPQCAPVQYAEELYRTGPVGDPTADEEEATNLLDASGNLILDPPPPAGAQTALNNLRSVLYGPDLGGP